MVRQHRHGRRPQRVLPQRGPPDPSFLAHSGLGENPQHSDAYTAKDLFRALAGEDAVVIAHVGGRYADIGLAHDGRLERAVEMHSTWGTFEWLLHDAFAHGYRVGIVCHSDDHKGRPGATHPGASTFGAIGGLTCYFMPELSRDALFEALRRRRHYGTTGTRLFMDLRATFAEPVMGFTDDPLLGAAARQKPVREAMMGDIIRPGAAPMQLAVEIVGTAPLDRLDILYGTQLGQTVRPYTAADLGRRVRVLWQGAEYRGRGRETHWQGRLTLSGNRIARFAAVNFLNPERQVREASAGTALAWTSVTTGNLAGIDLWLDDARRGVLELETNVVSGRVNLAALTDDTVTLEGGGLDRKLSVYRLPETDWPNRVAYQHTVQYTGAADLPVYVALPRPTATKLGRAQSISLPELNTGCGTAPLPTMPVVPNYREIRSRRRCRARPSTWHPLRNSLPSPQQEEAHGSTTAWQFHCLHEPQQATRPIQVIYGAAIIAAAARMAAAFGVLREPMLHVSASAWVLAFVGFVAVYAPLLLKRRQ